MKTVRLFVIEKDKSKFAEFDLGPIDEMKMKINYKDTVFSIDVNKEDVMGKIFTEENWLGKIKQHYLFCNMTDSGTLEPIGLEEFNPLNMFSAEEVDLMIHESMTMRGVMNLVTKIRGKGASKKLWVFIIILTVILAVVYAAYTGVI